MLAQLLSGPDGDGDPTRYVGSNIQITGFDDNTLRRNIASGKDGVTLSIGASEVSCYCDGKLDGVTALATVTSLHDFMDKYAMMPLMAGDYEVVVNKDKGGMEFGCTFIPWKMLRRIAALIPAEADAPVAPVPATDNNDD